MFLTKMIYCSVIVFEGVQVKVFKSRDNLHNLSMWSGVYLFMPTPTPTPTLNMKYGSRKYSYSYYDSFCTIN